MNVTDALSLTAGLLAIAAGVAKLVQPRTAVAAMRAAGMPSRPEIVRVGSACELVLGVLVLVAGSAIPRVLLALGYLGFATFAAVVMRDGRAVPCGCFGSQGAALGWRHVVTDLVLAAGLVVAAISKGPSAAHLVNVAPGLGLATVVVATVAALLAATYLSGPTVRERGSVDA